MPHRPPAAILIQNDRQHPDKQQALCLEYAETSGLQTVALCYSPADCMALVMVGKVEAVITAVDPGGHCAEDLERFGAKLHVVRETKTRVRRDVDHLVGRMYNSGLDTGQIATILEVNTHDVRRALYRAGIPRRRS